jgi:hypothetical protein
MKQMCLRLTLLASFVAAGPAVAMDIWGTGEVPSIADAKDVPRSLEAIWSGYEAHFDTHNPLEPVTHKSWEVDEIVVNWTQVTVGVFRGEKAAICGYWAYPKGAKNLPAILAFTGGGQGAIEGIAVEWAKLGYACFHPHNAQGRPRGLADGLPSTDWGVIAHKGGYGPYGSLVAQASTIDDVLSPRNSFYFPAGQVTWFNDEETKALYRRTIEALTFRDANSHVMLNIARARLSMPNAVEKFKGWVGTRERANGLFQWVGHGHSVYWTEMIGIAGFVNELLLQSVDNKIRLFPCWPEDQEASFRKLRAQGGFLVSAEFRDGRVASARIESVAERELQLLSPWKTIYVNGRKAEIDEQGLVTLQTRAGDVFLLLESAP